MNAATNMELLAIIILVCSPLLPQLVKSLMRFPSHTAMYICEYNIITDILPHIFLRWKACSFVDPPHGEFGQKMT